MSSLMECSLETIINIFHQYSTRLGHPDRLNQREFKQLVKKELPNFLKVGLGAPEGGCRLGGGWRRGAVHLAVLSPSLSLSPSTSLAPSPALAPAPAPAVERWCTGTHPPAPVARGAAETVVGKEQYVPETESERQQRGAGPGGGQGGGHGPSEMAALGPRPEGGEAGRTGRREARGGSSDEDEEGSGRKGTGAGGKAPAHGGHSPRGQRPAA